MAVILCYGDSNTHGTVPMDAPGAFQRHGRDARWPEVMADALGATHEVISEGLPGRTTVHEDIVEGGARNGLAVLPAVLLSHVPLDLVVIMLGTNDLKQRFSVSAFEIARSVERLVLRARADVPGVDVVLVAPAPVRENGSLAMVFAGAEARQAGLDGYLSDIATAQGCGFVAAGAHVAVSPRDGVHWDAAGHRAFGAAMAVYLAVRLA